MILFSSRTGFPQSMVAAVRSMHHDYEVRTLESFQSWNASNLLPHIDYKVIAVGMSFEDLRQAFKIFVSPMREGTMYR